MNAILAEGVKPTLSELERFEETLEGIDIELSSAGKEEAVHALSTGKFPTPSIPLKPCKPVLHYRRQCGGY
jgi:hypothetical protein